MIKWVVGAALVLNFYAYADENPAAAGVPMKPDPSYTTGDYCTKTDEDFSEVRYAEKVAVCRRAVTWFAKDVVYKNYGISDHCRQYYTVDHYIPLSMGGSNQLENLWPEHKDIKATRQNLEQQYYNKLAKGEVSLEYALRTIVHAKRNPPHVVPRGCN
jgi:hypothetical protein